MDDGIIAFSPVWMAEIFRTDVTRAFNLCTQGPGQRVLNCPYLLHSF